MLNFGIAAAYLGLRGRRVAYPAWVYVAAALLCWLPAAIYPAMYLSERRAGVVPEPVARRRIALAAAGLAAVVVVQAAVGWLLLSRGAGGVAGEWPEVCAAGFSVLWSAVLIVAAGRMER